MSFKQSLILTVHNKGFLLPLVLESIKKYTIGNYELIIVLDGCSDNSESISFDFKNKNKNLCIEILEAPDVFETKANNIGLRKSSGDISIIIQDDMVINELNWNNRLLKPFSVFDDVFAVTANCAHNWELNPNSKHLNSEIITDYEWSDILNHVDHANRNNTSRDQFSIRQCVNRGPLAINNIDLKCLNYLDESFAPLDMDDHDLCFRSKVLNKVVGCYWIDYISEPNWGGTRINGSPANWQLRSNQKNTKIVYERHKQLIKNKIIENRLC